MFEEAQKVIEEQLVTNTQKIDYLKSVSPTIPTRYTLRQLYDYVAGRPKYPDNGSIFSEIAILIVLDQCLSQREKITSEDGDTEAIQKLLHWLSKAIMPVGKPFIWDETSGDDQNLKKEPQLSQKIFGFYLGLKSIQYLQDNPAYPRKVDPDVLTCLIAFSRESDTWNSKGTYKTAKELLERHSKQANSRDFVIESLLAGFIRPLFSKSRPAAITSQGRKAIVPQDDSSTSRYSNHLDTASRPWKFSDVSSVTIFGWAVTQASDDWISESWNLFIPPLLTLLDDSSRDVRLRGLESLRAILPKMPQRMLEQTGLGEVLEDAVMPTLLFLPNLTPVEDSLKLLRSAYEALFILADKRFETKKHKTNRTGFYDRLMRKGILHGISHCSDNVSIMILLFSELEILITRMGVLAVKHLREIMPILSQTLCDAFAPSNTKLLLEGIKLTQKTILNCWPRMCEKNHRAVVIEMLSICWVNVTEEMQHGSDIEYNELQLIKKELKLAARLLLRCIGGVEDIRQELSPLINVDPTLSELFVLSSQITDTNRAEHYSDVVIEAPP